MLSPVACVVGPEGATDTMFVERATLVKNAVFRAMLTEDWIEGKNMEVRIPDIEERGFSLFVDHLDGFKLPEHCDHATAVAFLQCGKKYLENAIADRARILIQCEAHKNPEKALWMFAKIREAFGHDEAGLLSVVYGAVLFDPERALDLEDEDLLLLDAGDMSVLTGHEFLGRCSEKTVVRAMLSWAKTHLEHVGEEASDQKIREKLGGIFFNIRPMRMTNQAFMALVGNLCSAVERGSVNDFRFHLGNGGSFTYTSRQHPKMSGFHITSEIICGNMKGISTTDSVIFIIREDLVPITGEITRRLMQSGILKGLNHDGYGVTYDRGTYYLELIRVRENESFELEEEFLIHGADLAEEHSPITWGPGVLSLKVLPQEYADGRKFRYLLSIGVDFKCDMLEGSVPIGLARGDCSGLCSLMKSMLAKGGRNTSPPMQVALHFEDM